MHLFAVFKVRVFEWMEQFFVTLVLVLLDTLGFYFCWVNWGVLDAKLSNVYFGLSCMCGLYIGLVYVFELSLMP